MTALRLDHIGIAVVSIDDALAVYRALGLEEEHREEVPSQKVVTALLRAPDEGRELRAGASLQPAREILGPSRAARRERRHGARPRGRGFRRVAAGDHARGLSVVFSGDGLLSAAARRANLARRDHRR